MTDTLAALASDVYNAIATCGGHKGFARWLETSPRGPEAMRIMEARADRLGVTLPEVIAALKAEADRRGYRRLTVH